MRNFLTFINKERHLSPQFIAAVKWVANMVWNVIVIIIGTLFIIAMLCFAFYGIAALLALVTGACGNGRRNCSRS